MKLKLISLLGMSASVVLLDALPTVGFEDLLFAEGNFENGSNLTGTETVESPFGSPVTVRRSTFNSSGGGFSADFDNEYTVDYNSWTKWAYSKDTDTVTSGFGNQFSAIAGSGARGSTNYGIANGSNLVRFNAAQDFSGRGFDVTNTTYAHNSMRDGDSFAKKFGDDPATEGTTETVQPDWFMLTIEGRLSGESTGSLDFYLADYRFVDDADDFIVDTWEFVDLSSLGTIDELSFSLSSSDTGDFGMNTPAYFAIDNIGVVPEPSASVLFAGILALGLLGRRRR